MNRAPDAAPRLARWTRALSLACFVLYTLNVLASRAAISLKWTLPHMGDIAEFRLRIAIRHCSDGHCSLDGLSG
jgi:hypothetical protein